MYREERIMQTSIDLYQGDCLSKLEELYRDNGCCVDMVLVDLPYGTTACKWDTVIDLERMWYLLSFVCEPNAPMIFTASQPFTSRLVSSNISKFKHEWVWEKNRGSNFGSVKYQPMKEHESVLVFCNGKLPYYPIKEPRKGAGADRVKYEFNGSNTGKRDAYSGFVDNRKGHMEDELRYPSSIQKFNTEVGKHPTQKPVALMEYLIKTYTQEGETVLDFTMGSGTTGVACKNLNRNFIGIELDPEYFRIAKERVESA
jgi:site-specific DNA-methyltransferase (adenine-specific)